LCPANADRWLNCENALVSEERRSLELLFVNAIVSATREGGGFDIESKLVVQEVFILAGLDVLPVDKKANRSVADIDIAHETHIEIVENLAERDVHIGAAPQQASATVQ